MSEVNRPPTPEYPATIQFIAVKELHAKTHRPPDAKENFEGLGATFNLSYSDFNKETKKVQISMAATVGEKEGDMHSRVPFYIHVSLIAEFIIDDARFPIHRLGEWCGKNAPLIMYPFLREQIHTISARLGYSPLILPLLSIPTNNPAYNLAREQ